MGLSYEVLSPLAGQDDIALCVAQQNAAWTAVGRLCDRGRGRLAACFPEFGLCLCQLGLETGRRTG